MRPLHAVLLLTLSAPIVLAQDPSGHWEGTVQVPSGPSRLILDLARNRNGAWAASLDLPERSFSGLSVAGLTVAAGKVTFTVPELPGKPVLQLTQQDRRLAGTFSTHGQSLLMEMMRTGEAKLNIPSPSPAVSKKLEGDWDGTLDLPNGRSRALVFHFRNLPDHTVSATMDSPSQGAQGLGLAGVTQNGREVQFTIRIHGGHFKGALNPEGNQLTGEWIQSPTAAPLPCKMKKR